MKLIPKAQGGTDFRRGPLNFVLSYYQSPGFKKRFKNLKFLPINPDPTIKTYHLTPSRKVNIAINPPGSTKETNNGMYKKYGKKQINIGDFKGDFKKAQRTIAHELGHWIDDNIHVLTKYVWENNKYNYHPLLHYSDFIPHFRKNSKLNKFYLLKGNFDNEGNSKEIIKRDVHNFPSFAIRYYYPDVYLYTDYHDALPDESYGDLMRMRWSLFDSKIFDSRDPDKIFDEQMLQKYKLKYPNDRLFKYYEDDDIIKMVNEVAQNNNLNDNINDGTYIT